MANYNSKYTGQQIDEAVGKSLGTIINSGEVDNGIVGLWKLDKPLIPLATITTQEEYDKWYNDGDYYIDINAYSEINGTKRYWEYIYCVLINGTFNMEGELMTYDNYIVLGNNLAQCVYGRVKSEYDDDFSEYNGEWSAEGYDILTIEDDENYQSYEELFRSCGTKLNPLDTIKTKDGVFKAQNVDTSLYGKHLYKLTFNCIATLHPEGTTEGTDNNARLVIITSKKSATARPDATNLTCYLTYGSTLHSGFLFYNSLYGGHYYFTMLSNGIGDSGNKYSTGWKTVELTNLVQSKVEEFI